VFVVVDCNAVVHPRTVAVRTMLACRRLWFSWRLVTY
jgi:hypothetical protein